MKKLSGLILTFVFILFLSAQGFAQSEVTSGKSEPVKQTTTVKPGTFVDKDGNGICDNYEAGGKNAKGANFVDANGDGICDRRGDGTMTKCKQNCCNQQPCAGKGKGPKHPNCPGPCGKQQTPDKK